MAKSSIFVSPNTDASLAASLSQMVGIPLTENLGKYLGYHLFMGSLKRVLTHIFLIDAYQVGGMESKGFITDRKSHID